MLAGQRDVIEAIAAPVLASSARTDVKAKLQFAVIASFGSGSIRHGRARSARPPEAVEPDDEEVPARMKTVVQYLVAGTATLALAGTGFAADVLVYPPEGPVRGAAEQGFLGVLQLGQGAERRRSRRPAPAGAARPAHPRRGRGGGARRRARRGGRGDRRRRREACGRGGRRRRPAQPGQRARGAVGGGGARRRARRGGRGDRRRRREGCGRGGGRRRRCPRASSVDGRAAGTAAGDAQRLRPRLRRLHGRPGIHGPMSAGGSGFFDETARRERCTA